MHIETYEHVVLLVNYIRDLIVALQFTSLESSQKQGNMAVKEIKECQALWGSAPRCARTLHFPFGIPTRFKLLDSVESRCRSRLED